MISEFVREQKRYTQKDLYKILRCSEEKAIPLIRKLKEFGVLKAVKASDLQRDMSDLVDEDIEVADVEIGEDEYLYVFTFVGVIVVAGRVLKCYPKYLLNADCPKNELRQVLKVLEKYNTKEQIVRMFNDSSESNAFNLLAVLLFLLQDYYENGVYSNTEDIIESNGSGEILWDKTINETFTLLSNNRPYYIDLQTKKRVTDDYDYFKRLHECILTKASEELKEAELLDLFEITGVDLTDEVLDDFGEEEYNLVWEGICADIMDNQLDVRLGALQLPTPLKPEYDRKQKLIDLIEKPLWSVTGKTASDTLIPDLVSITGNKFIIFDVKYYNAVLEPGQPPKAQPGIESVTKQYLYQLAYQKFITDHAFEGVENCFLMPTEAKNIIHKGEASMQMLSALGLQNIKVRFLPADMVYEHYLSGRKMEISMLEL